MKKLLLLFLVLCIEIPLQAQEFQLDADIRMRYEHRNGYGEPKIDSLHAANFVAQRTRLNFHYTKGKTALKVSPQSVRVWGESPQGAKSDVNGLQMYEAWIQYALSPKFTFQAGRQELNYDDARILGNADWNMQARSHDALLLKITPKSKQQLHLGAALNAQRETNFKETYAVKNQYKNLQFLHYSGVSPRLSWSLLFMNQTVASATNQTFGGRTSLKFPAIDLSVSAYGQTGKVQHQPLRAYLLMAKASWKNLGQWKPELGIDYLSGKGQNDQNTTLKSFTPWYGTNHKFNGHMDYFYVGNHLNSVGLIDVFGQVAYGHQKWKGSFTPHYFWAAAAVNRGRSLGFEGDFSLSYQLAPDLQLSGGYSFFQITERMKQLKGEGRSLNHWVFISVHCHPKLLNKG